MKANDKASANRLTLSTFSPINEQRTFLKSGAVAGMTFCPFDHYKRRIGIHTVIVKLKLNIVEDECDRVHTVAFHPVQYSFDVARTAV